MVSGSSMARPLLHSFRGFVVQSFTSVRAGGTPGTHLVSMAAPVGASSMQRAALNASPTALSAAESVARIHASSLTPSSAALFRRGMPHSGRSLPARVTTASGRYRIRFAQTHAGGSRPVRAQEPDQILRVGERLESERRLDDRVLLAARHRRVGEFVELLDDVGSTRERVLAPARRLARFALDRAIAQ